MKKIIFTALCLALVLSASLLAGCGTPAEDSFDDVVTHSSSMDSLLDGTNVTLTGTDTIGQVSDTSTVVESSAESSQIIDESEPAKEISGDESPSLLGGVFVQIKRHRAVSFFAGGA